MSWATAAFVATTIWFGLQVWGWILEGDDAVAKFLREALLLAVVIAVGGQGRHFVVDVRKRGPDICVPVARTRRPAGCQTGPSRIWESIIRDFMANDFGGTVDLSYEPGGVMCELKAPLKNLPA